jgi:hypothetical protein
VSFADAQLRCPPPRTQLKLLKDAPTLTHALLLHKDRTSHDPENCQGNQGNREQHRWSDGDDDENFAKSLSLSINLVCVVTGGSREYSAFFDGIFGSVISWVI